MKNPDKTQLNFFEFIDKTQFKIKGALVLNLMFLLYFYNSLPHFLQYFASESFSSSQ